MEKPTFDQVPSLLLQNLEGQKKIEKQLSDFHTKIDHLSQPDRKELLTIKEACELLQITRTTLWRWCKKGTVKSYGMEGEKYFKRSEIMEALIPLNH